MAKNAMNSNLSTRTRSLLRFGVLVGPFYLAVGLIQAFVREGYDLSRHALSHLSNGPGGWVQTLNFLLSGLMVIAAAMGIARALRSQSRAGAWALGLFGLSMIAAAAFPADPVDGFPPGAPSGMPETVSTTGMIHFMAGGAGFLALAISCILVAFAFRRRKESTAFLLSLLSGVFVVAGFFGPSIVPASGPVAGIWFSVVVGWTWLAITSAHLARGIHAPNVEDPAPSTRDFA